MKASSDRNPMKYLLLALSLTACGLVDDLDKALDGSPPDPPKVFHIPRCAQDSTRDSMRCDPSPPKAGAVVNLGNGGER